MADQVLNQNNYQDSQNFEIDINKIYLDFIKEIDSVRSIINTSIKSNEYLLTKLNNKSILKLPSSLKVESTPQESRCHAFFRLIGFPVLSKDDKMYNPGFDNLPLTKQYENTISVKKIGLSDKIEIANDPIPGFIEMSIKRESYPNNFAKIFAFTGTIDAAVLALSSSTNIRSFIAPLEDSDDPLFLQNKSYSINFDSKVGQYSMSLDFFVDSNGNKATKVSKERFHYIRPFLVDPRIDFSVSPAKNKIAVPFVNDKFDLKVNEIDYVRRPLIEKIIRDRISITPTTELGTADQELFDRVKTIASIKDENIIKKVFSTSVTVSDQQQFAKFLNIISAMCIKLVDSQLFISDAQDKYYWLPVPSKDGPESGSGYQSIIINPPDNFRTDRDTAIVKAQVTNTINQLTASVVNTIKDTDLGQFAFDSFKTTFGSDNAEALGDISADTLKQLLAERASFFTDASDALRTIEIIMGEFSGLGLCDIIAIMGSLYIIPIEDLLGFLDDDSYDRMINSLKLSPDSFERSSIRKSLTSLTSSVKDYYTLMDKIYEDLRRNNNIR